MFAASCTPSRRAVAAWYLPIVSGLLLSLVGSDCVAVEQDAWIWSPLHEPGRVPVGNVYFRKHFNLMQPKSGTIEIAADDEYVLYVNGARIGEGKAWRRTESHDVSEFLVHGKNVIAVKAGNSQNAYAGLMVHLSVTERNGNTIQLQSDRSWKSSVNPLPLWHLSQYNDFRWKPAQALSHVASKSADDSEQNSVESTNGTRGDSGATTVRAKTGTFSGEATGGTDSPQGQDDAQDKTEDEPVLKPQSKPTPRPPQVAAQAPVPSEASILNPTRQPRDTERLTEGKDTSEPADPKPSEKPERGRGEHSKKASAEKAKRESGKPLTMQPLAEYKPVSPEDMARPEGFVVERSDCHPQTGSLIALAFNEFGDLLVSREEGPLQVIEDTNQDGTLDAVREYSSRVTNCQGILPLNGDVFVIGVGDEGAGLYRLQDADSDGLAEVATLLVKVAQDRLEHGAHGLVLGPDGKIYIMFGNHARVAAGYAKTGPYANYYEGDLIRPRYEDPGGHAVGVKAPGGVVVRCDLEGNDVELFAGGFRNPYDLAFNRSGDLFTHDADMEADDGASWYRPTRVNHVIPGAEFGWRSGWAKWPDYYYDSLPATVDTGRGSPAGLVFYQHNQFPRKYQNSLFSCDWSEGRILAIHMTTDGASYRGRKEVFLEGRPLNATDIDVAPDGSLVFATGGRGTRTLLYRVRFAGAPDMPLDRADSIMKAVRQPQPQSAWGRQQIAEVQDALGDSWASDLKQVITSSTRAPTERAAALQLARWYGPDIDLETLETLSHELSADLRAGVAYQLGLMDVSDSAQAMLVALATDRNASVRRRALESLRRGGYKIPVGELEKSLKTTDRFESWSARELVESIPVSEWSADVLASTTPRMFLQLALARLTVAPDKQFSMESIAKVTELWNDYLSDRDFLDTVRLMQLALMRGKVTHVDLPRLGEIVGEEFPAKDAQLNRETIRVLAHLKEASIKHRYLQYLESEVTPVEKLHFVAHLRHLEAMFNTQDKIKIIRALHQESEDAASLPPYIQNIGRDLAGMLSTEERRMVLAGGAVYPEAAMAVLYQLPSSLSTENIRDLKVLDRRLTGVEGDAADKLRIGVIAVLARSADAEAMRYLRQLYDRDRKRQATIAIGLAQKPDSENWQYLIRSLRILDEPASKEILDTLASVDRRPDDADSYWQVFENAHRYPGTVADSAVALLRHWSAKDSPAAKHDVPGKISPAWREWYAKRFPDGPRLSDIASSGSRRRHDFEKLLTEIVSSPETPQAIRQGAQVYRQAQCEKCHRFGNRGETMGPDLTQVSRRFDARQTLESILFPSRVISDQYASRTVLVDSGRTHTGIVGSGGRRELVILKPNGSKVRIERSEVEEIVPSNVSAMPSGLLDPFSVEQIDALFAYLNNPPPTKRRTANAPRRFGRKR